MTSTPQMDFFAALPVARSFHSSVRASIEQAHGFHCDGPKCGGWVAVHGRWNGVKLCSGCRGVSAPMWNPHSYAVRSETGEVLASCGDNLDAFHVAAALRPGVPDYDCVTCESTGPDATKQTFLAGFVSWHGIACLPASGYSWQCAVAFVVGIFLLRGKPRFNARSAYREAPVW